MSSRIQVRRGTLAAWAAANPVLAAGEPGYETDSGAVRLGDGASAWAALTSLAGVSRLLAPSGDGTGSTDTAALQAAITTFGAAGRILLMPGTYYWSGITLQNLAGFHLEGSGKAATVINVVGTGSIGLNATGNAGTGSVKYTTVRNLQINCTGTNCTALQVWNNFGLRFESCIFQSDYLAASIQGSFVGTFDDCEFYITGANLAPVAALWIGSGKSAPHTGAVTLSGCGSFTFDGCLIQSFNKASAIIMEENTFPSRFQSCQLLAKGGTVPMVQIDGAATQATFDDCYSEANNNASADFAIGVAEGSCGYFACRDYNSTGSSGQNYAFDIAACRRLLIEKPNCINYTLGVHRFRTGYLPTGATDSQCDIRLADTGASTGQTIYADDDSHIASTYRGPVQRMKNWRALMVRSQRLDAAIVTGASTLILDGNEVAAGSGATATSGVGYFYIDPADYGYAPLRVRVSVLVNATAPTVNVNVGLVPSSGAPAGGASAVTQANGGFVMASAAVAIPAAGSQNIAVSAIGYVTTAGWYALAVSPGGAFAASSSVAVTARLEALS